MIVHHILKIATTQSMIKVKKEAYFDKVEDAKLRFSTCKWYISKCINC